MSSNLEQLTQAGVVKANDLSEAEKKVVDSLSPSEVQCLISIKSKVHQHWAAELAQPKII